MPGTTMPTVSMVAPLQQYPARLYEPQSPAKKRPDYGRRSLLQLLSLGALLEVLFLALYPLFAGVTSGNDAANQALPGLFPWISRLYWMRAVPVLVQLLAQVPGFNLATASGTINFLVLLFALSFILVVIAGRIGSRVGQERLLRPQIRALFCTIMIITLVFSVTYLFAPAILTLSQDVFLYGLYGRLVTVYHVNPYSVSLGAFPHDLLQQGILQGTQATQATQAVKGTRSPGPVWIDLSIPVVLLARESVANVILGFRLIGLAAHLVNAVLIWVIVGKLKPEARIFATVLYAWNPLVLLLSINEMFKLGFNSAGSAHEYIVPAVATALFPPLDERSPDIAGRPPCTVVVSCSRRFWHSCCIVLCSLLAGLGHNRFTYECAAGFFTRYCHQLPRCGIGQFASKVASCVNLADSTSPLDDICHGDCRLPAITRLMVG